MNENLKLYAKISLKSVGVWLLFAGLGTLITIITFFVAFAGSTSFMNGGSGAHAGKAAILIYIIEFIQADPCGFLLVFGAPFFLATYYALASKTAIQHGLCLVWKNRGRDYLEPIIKGIVQRVVTKQMHEKFNQVRIKAGFRDINNADSSIHPIQKRLLNYAVKKTKLEDLDHSKEEMSLDEVISHRVLLFFSEMAEPSYWLFWLLLILQFIMMIVSIAM